MATRREELAEAATDYALRARPDRAQPAAARRGARHQRPDAALPLPRQGRPASRRSSAPPRPARWSASGHCPPSRRPALRGARPLAGHLDRAPSSAASGSTSRRRRSGLFGHEPYATEVREANARGWRAVAEHFRRCRARPRPRRARPRTSWTRRSWASSSTSRWTRGRSSGGRSATSPTRSPRGAAPQDTRPAARSRRRHGTSSPSATRPARQRSRCSRLGPGAFHRARRARSPPRRGPAAISRPRHWRSVPSQACPRRGGPSYAGWPASRHAQRVARPDRPRTPARPPCRPGRRAPSPRPTRWRPSARPSGSRSVASGLLGGGDGGRWELHPGHHPGQHAAHVGVEHGLPPPEREGQHGGGGVVADAGQGAERVVGVGDGAAVLLGDRGGGARAAAVARRG